MMVMMHKDKRFGYFAEVTLKTATFETDPSYLVPVMYVFSMLHFLLSPQKKCLAKINTASAKYNVQYR